MMSATGCTCCRDRAIVEQAARRSATLSRCSIAQNEQTSVGRQPAAVETGDELFAGNR